MKKILFFFLSFLLFSCQNEYIQFHQNKEIQTQIVSQNEDFSLESISDFSGITLKKTPDIKLLDTITQRIDSAQKRVYVEVYIFTEKNLAKALKKAKKRGLDVKVLLEKNVYLAGNLNTKMFEDLKKNGIEIAYSNTKNYSLNHSKMMIIDDEVMISTGNYSYSTFKYNREFFLFLKNETYTKLFEQIFQADFAGIKKDFSDGNLVLSPFSSRTKLEYLITHAQKSIQIYAHNFGDAHMLSLLADAQKSGKEIQVILPDLKKVPSNKETFDFFDAHNIPYIVIDKPEIHAKSLLIDGKYLYIGSVNYSAQSMDENREIGMLFKNSEIISQFQDFFLADFHK